LYSRTVGLLNNNSGVALSDLAEFRERMSTLPDESQMVLYASSGRVSKAGQGLTANLWPAYWPHLISIAIGFNATQKGATVETNARFNPKGPRLGPSDPPIHTLSLLPASTVAAWTHTIDYVDEFRKLNSTYPTGPVRLYLDVLQYGLPPGTLEQNVFAHLVGDTIFVIGRSQKSESSGDKIRSSLQIPVFAMVVDTDNPQVVETAVRQLADNLLRLLRLLQTSEDAVQMRTEPLAAGDGAVYSIDIGRLPWPKGGSTSSDMVRQIIEACRGEYPWISNDTLFDVINDVHLGGDLPKIKILMVAQPALAGEMIDSWLAYASRNHPEIFKPDWWQNLRRKQRASGIQLGIEPDRTRKLKGMVQVARTIQKKPAHNRLKKGDRIFSVDGKKLHPVKTEASLRMLLASRRYPNRVQLGIVRDSKRQTISIPMPDETTSADQIQPILLLRQAADLLQIFSSASHVVWQPTPDLVSTRLELIFTPPKGYEK